MERLEKEEEKEEEEQEEKQEVIKKGEGGHHFHIDKHSHFLIPSFHI